MELTVECDTTESTTESSASEKTDSLSVVSGGSSLLTRMDKMELRTIQHAIRTIKCSVPLV